MNVPEPTTAKLVDKKTAAYEKQQAEVEEESRMKSLEQLAGTLMNEGKGASDTGEKEKDGDRLQQSVNTYEQISGQLNDFYETPKETANSDLERKVDELNKKLEEAEKEKNKAATREELMERSYKRDVWYNKARPASNLAFMIASMSYTAGNSIIALLNCLRSFAYARPSL